ncbi:MAG: class I SAM-dependent methyltransferase, partial [Isosphaeraceae bacterium]|nr:class I SAM-dependent methyltransferase [Isosphaeraceae bacterium]
AQGTEVTLAGCGLDLRAHGTINLMAPTTDPRKYWGVARICLVPLLGWEGQPPEAVEALINGIPIIASDRGSLPETLGAAGIVLSLPDRITPATRILPTAEEVVPWTEAIIRLWDDREFAEDHCRKALTQARRWSPDILETRYARFFSSLGSRHTVSADLPLIQTEDAARRRIKFLAEAFPWPSERPSVEASNEHPGWLGAGADEALARVLSARTRLVIELGAWRGMSTRFIADLAPNATVISIDHWEGSPEHRTQEKFQRVLATLYDTFLAECWAYRDRVIPLRMTSLVGLLTVADYGLSPDLIYIDAEHSYEAVISELELSRHLFPRATLVGDDYDWEGVQRAVGEFAWRHGLTVERVGWRGWRLAERRPAGALVASPPPGRSKAVVMVPHLSGIEWECEQNLRQLEQAGVRVVRRIGSSAIDVARNAMISDALHDGFESMMFIDADIGFDPQDVLRLLARPESVVCGIYAKKGQRGLASHFADGVIEVLFGPDAPGLYPVQYAATGFLRIKANVLRKMIEELKLPLCNTKWGRGVWPFFMPMITPHEGGKLHYLGEDWAFSYRLGLKQARLEARVV